MVPSVGSITLTLPDAPTAKGGLLLPASALGPAHTSTPPQDLSVFIGMGSASGLTMFGCNDCNNEPFYKPKLSSTWNKTIPAGGPFEVAYDTIQVLGKTVEKAACGEARRTADSSPPSAPVLTPQPTPTRRTRPSSTPPSLARRVSSPWGSVSG